MAVLIDTDILVDLHRGRPSFPLNSITGVGGISVVTVAEMLEGASYGGPELRLRRRMRIEELLSVFDAIPITKPVARVRADIWTYLREQGAQIGPNDLWIAATAVAHDFELVTRNTREFSRVPGLRLAAV